MAQHPKVIGAMVEAAARMGTGAGGREILHAPIIRFVQLERELADLHAQKLGRAGVHLRLRIERNLHRHHRQAVAELSVVLFSVLTNNPRSKVCASRAAKRKIWRHNDLGHLEELLTAVYLARPKLIVFESLYSMDGASWRRSMLSAISPDATGP